jgi:hypothetical protein
MGPSPPQAGPTVWPISLNRSTDHSTATATASVRSPDFTSPAIDAQPLRASACPTPTTCEVHAHPGRAWENDSRPLRAKGRAAA